MTDASEIPAERSLESTRTVAHVVYALHAFAILVGILGAPTVVGSFVGSVPSIAAVILSYVKRGAARGTWLESHYRWQIRTFWYVLIAVIGAWIALFTILLIPIGIAMLVATTFWVIYRIARGWLALLDGAPLPT